jgi:hypothetical protein
MLNLPPSLSKIRLKTVNYLNSLKEEKSHKPTKSLKTSELTKNPKFFPDTQNDVISLKHTKSEQLSPNPAKSFFKTASDWIQLSGYANQFVSQENHSKSPPAVYFPSNPRSNLEISQEAHEERVETAINYLVLRDLGCSRENAMTLTSRKRPDNGSFVKSLPNTLRKDFSASIKKSRCLPCRPPATYENFDSISQAFKDLILKKQVFLDTLPSNHQKKVEELEGKRKEKKINYENMKRQETKLKVNRVVVPDIKTVKITESSQNISSLPSPELLPKLPKFQENNDFLLFPSELKPTHLGRSQKLSVNSLSNENKSLIPKSERVKTSQSSIGPSELLVPSLLKSPKTQESSVSGFEIKVETAEVSEEDSSEVNYPKLVDEDKRLINLIRLQKYRQAQIRGEEFSKSLQKTRQRKKMQDSKNQEEKIKKFEKKKEKIFMAKLKKENLKIKKKHC